MAIVRTPGTVLSSDGKTQLHTMKWTDDTVSPKAVLQISHGMCEYIERYDEFASWLAQRGYVVFGNDHLGHGHSVSSMNDLGYLAEKDGYKLLSKDLRIITELLHEEYPGLPLALLGHSMGSFIARYYASEYSDGVDAYIFEGTDGSNPQSFISLLVINTLSLFKGERFRSELVKNISFMGYLSRIEDHPTGCEWVTSDPEKLDAYVHDPYCMYTFTLSGYRDMVKCLDIILRMSWAYKLNENLPYLLVSGEEDPVGDFGRGVRHVYDMMKAAGCSNTTIKLYPGQRHELHNETNREIFFKDTLEWLNTTLGVYTE